MRIHSGWIQDIIWNDKISYDIIGTNLISNDHKFLKFFIIKVHFLGQILTWYITWVIYFVFDKIFVFKNKKLFSGVNTVKTLGCYLPTTAGNETI